VFSLVFSRTPLPPSSTLFPYTTLFRSKRRRQSALIRKGCAADAFCFVAVKFRSTRSLAKSFPATLQRRPGECWTTSRRFYEPKRSEEHTSELQSLRHLVCRLLLEKKKK